MQKHDVGTCELLSFTRRRLIACAVGLILTPRRVATQISEVIRSAVFALGVLGLARFCRSFGLPQTLNHSSVTSGQSNHLWSSQITSHRERIGALLQQQLDDCEVTFAGGPVKRSPT